MKEESPYMKLVSDAMEKLALALIEPAPQGWALINLVAVQVGRTGQQQSFTRMSDGSTISYGGVGLDAHRALKVLRQSLSTPGKGAWYTARCTVTDTGNITIDYDYDSEPEWDIDIVPATYVEDLEMFPRDLEHQPMWLQEKLRQAQDAG